MSSNRVLQSVAVLAVATVASLAGVVVFVAKDVLTVNWPKGGAR